MLEVETAAAAAAVEAAAAAAAIVVSSAAWAANFDSSSRSWFMCLAISQDMSSSMARVCLNALSGVLTLPCVASVPSALMERARCLVGTVAALASKRSIRDVASASASANLSCSLVISLRISSLSATSILKSPKAIFDSRTSTLSSSTLSSSSMCKGHVSAATCCSETSESEDRQLPSSSLSSMDGIVALDTQPAFNEPELPFKPGAIVEPELPPKPARSGSCCGNQEGGDDALCGEWRAWRFAGADIRVKCRSSKGNKY
mmetsp:Transcript_45375/g.87290  ORF Transcript_45375/g.87290 Transcript_45375/m.87290 type:complete len:260 (+) Transcript_45375:133-912(+)